MLELGVLGAFQLRDDALRQHFTERDYDYKRFRVETQQSGDVKAIPSGDQ